LLGLEHTGSKILQFGWLRSKRIQMLAGGQRRDHDYHKPFTSKIANVFCKKHAW
jgi:hypothetical protein